MPLIFQPIATDGVPDFLTLGHVTRDLLPDGSFTPGGTVTFAALTAYHLGLVTSVVTCADALLIADFPRLLPDIGVAGHVSEQTTIFVNTYHDGFRTQYLKARSGELRVEDVPETWRDASIILFGPLDLELTPEVLSAFPRRPGAIRAATPQGWLRRWDSNGRVWPAPWEDAETVLPLLDALILSHDDLLPFADGNRVEADAMLARWSMHVPLLVATDGKYGATLFQQGNTEVFPAYTANEVDPTGAGDVFAAAFLIHLSRHGDPRAAVDFANCVASISIGYQGATGIPTMEMVQQRMSQPRSVPLSL